MERSETNWDMSSANLAEYGLKWAQTHFTRTGLRLTRFSTTV